MKAAIWHIVIHFVVALVGALAFFAVAGRLVGP